MKSTTFGIFVFAFQVAHVFAGVAPSAAEECGDLGVMAYTDAALAKGINTTGIRTCKEHPLGPNPRPEPQGLGESDAKRDLDDLLNPREELQACWYGDPYGCSKGYCYKVCGDNGRWCWTAWNGGWGDWRTCSAKDDCKDTQGAECGEGGCKACGCSC